MAKSKKKSASARITGPTATVQIAAGLFGRAGSVTLGSPKAHGSHAVLLMSRMSAKFPKHLAKLVKAGREVYPISDGTRITPEQCRSIAVRFLKENGLRTSYLALNHLNSCPTNDGWWPKAEDGHCYSYPLESPGIQNNLILRQARKQQGGSRELKLAFYVSVHVRFPKGTRPA